jgi:hypothetical protein
MKPVFLIVDPDAFVAEDLSEIIRETVPGAQVIHSTVADGNTMRIVAETGVYGVFLTGRAEEPTSARIGAELVRLGVSLAWIGDAASRGITAEIGLRRVSAPFTAEAVAKVLRAWSQKRPFARAEAGDAVRTGRDN